MTSSRRTLTTVLFTDIVGSTRRATELGDRAWRELQSRHHRVVRTALRRWGGREVTEAGDGFLATFDRPARAIVCARTIVERVRELGLEVRCGIHMGQIEQAPDGSAGGIAVHVGARVGAEAGPGEVVVTSAVRDTEEGSGFRFEDLGPRELHGLDRQWQLFRVTGVPDHAEGLAPGRREVLRRHATSRPALLAAALVAVAVAAFVVVDPGGPGPALASEIRSLAILPLDNLTGDPEQAYLVDGMTEALIAELSKVGALNVISRTSSSRYRDSNLSLPRIAAELDVTGLAEGSVARIGERVRITVQLIHARTDTHVWAETYEAELVELPAVQGEIARTIAGAIEIALNDDERSRLSSEPAIAPAAYEAYLKGRYHLSRQSPEDISRGLAYLEEAVASDPGSALAHAGVALGYMLAAHGPAPPPNAFQRATVSARRALELDETLAEAHAALAQIRQYQDWDWEGAEASFRRALELNPSLPETRAHWSWYLALMGRMEEAMTEMRRARSADPLNPLWSAWLGWQQWSAGDLDGAIEAARASLELDPDYPVGLYVLGSALAAQGRDDEAIAAHQRAADVAPMWRFALGVTHALAGREQAARDVARDLEANRTFWDTYFLAQIHLLLGDRQEAFRWLEEACARPHHPYIPWIGGDPLLRPLFEDPRFVELQRRMNLPEAALVTARS